MAASWGSSSGRSRTAVMPPIVGRSARPDLPARGGLLDQVGAARAARLRGHLDHVDVRVATGEHVQLAHLVGRGEAGPAAGDLDGDRPLLEDRARLDGGRDVEAAEGVPGREGEQGPGEPVAAEVGGLPRRLGPAPGQRRGDRPADLGAAAVAATVGADEPERGVVRRPVAVRTAVEVAARSRSSRASASGSTTVRTSKPSGVARAWKTRTPGPDSPPCRRISCTRTPVRPARWSRTASGSRLSATALRPHEPGVLDEQEGRVGRARCRRSAHRRRDWRRSSGSRSRGQSARAPAAVEPEAARSRPGGSGRLRAGRCAGRSPRPRCGRRRRACRGCWRRGPTRSWWR